MRKFTVMLPDGSVVREHETMGGLDQAIDEVEQMGYDVLDVAQRGSGVVDTLVVAEAV